MLSSRIPGWASTNRTTQQTDPSDVTLTPQFQPLLPPINFFFLLDFPRQLIMPPHLHPRSRSTASLFATTLLASLVVVGLPHVFPCPAPRRTLADSEMMVTADGQQVQRIRRRRRKDVEMFDRENTPYPAPQPADEEVSTFFQMEAEAEKLEHVRRQCPVPKPSGVLGDLLGFSNQKGTSQQQGREEF